MKNVAVGGINVIFVDRNWPETGTRTLLLYHLQHASRAHSYAFVPCPFPLSLFPSFPLSLFPSFPIAFYLWPNSDFQPPPLARCYPITLTPALASLISQACPGTPGLRDNSRCSCLCTEGWISIAERAVPLPATLTAAMQGRDHLLDGKSARWVVSELLLLGAPLERKDAR